MNEEIMDLPEEETKDLPSGVIYGPVEIPGGVPEGWKVCDGQNGTPRLDSTSLENLAMLKRKTYKEFAYVMKE